MTTEVTDITPEVLAGSDFTMMVTVEITDEGETHFVSAQTKSLWLSDETKAALAAQVRSQIDEC